MIGEYAGHLASKVIVLASASPRRAEILGLMRLPFEVRSSTFAETLPKGSFGSAADYARATAAGKAREVFARSPDADLVIGSDTIVVLDGRILEKPASEADSYEMLAALSGREHVVISAVAMFVKRADKTMFPEPEVLFHEETRVSVAKLTNDAISAYIKTGEPADKAGSYGIQGLGGMFVEKVNGCYFSVMGLPMHRTALAIRSLIESKKL